MLRLAVENLGYWFWEWLRNGPDVTGESLIDAVGLLSVPEQSKRPQDCIRALQRMLMNCAKTVENSNERNHDPLGAAVGVGALTA